MTILASGRWLRISSTTFRPVPSSRRMSRTAKAGGLARTALMASDARGQFGLEAALLERPAQARTQRRVVVEQQQALVGQSGDVAGGVGHLRLPGRSACL